MWRRRHTRLPGFVLRNVAWTIHSSNQATFVLRNVAPAQLPRPSPSSSFCEMLRRRNCASQLIEFVLRLSAARDRQRPVLVFPVAGNPDFQRSHVFTPFSLRTASRIDENISPSSASRASRPARAFPSSLSKLSLDDMKWQQTFGATERRHCERSEAIQAAVQFLDCFVADAPRNDGSVIASEAKQSRRRCRCWIACR